MNNPKTNRPGAAWFWTLLPLTLVMTLTGGVQAQPTPAVKASTGVNLAKESLAVSARKGALQVNEKVLRVQLNDLGRPSAASAASTTESTPAANTPAARPLVAPAQASSANEAVTQLNRAPLDGVVFHSDSSQTQLDTHASSVTLRQGDLLVARSQNEPEPVAKPQLEGATSVKLPYEVLFLDEQGTTRHCQVVAEMAGGGMRLIGDSVEFTTQIYVGLRDQDRWDTVYALPRPLRLLVTGNVDKVAPDLLTLERTDDFKPVELRAADPPSEVKVQVRAADRGLELNVPVHRPRATIDVNPTTIQGFGLESAQVNVRTEGLPNPNGRSVRLRTSSGRLEPATLTLNENGVAHAELRSAGFGPVSVEVSVFQLTPDRSEVEFAWPWRFLGFALLGGVLGSAIQWLRAPSGRKRVNLKPSLAGVLTGLLAAAASAVGINLLSIDLPSLGGESLALVIAALGAWRLKADTAPTQNKG
jgi:hypothetical protein